jgi:hypothetical protein
LLTARISIASSTRENAPAHRIFNPLRLKFSL